MHGNILTINESVNGLLDVITNRPFKEKLTNNEILLLRNWLYLNKALLEFEPIKGIALILENSIQTLTLNQDEKNKIINRCNDVKFEKRIFPDSMPGCFQPFKERKTSLASVR